ncbi:MAG: cell division protein FtsB [Gammaproteobacteria bacterium]|nr:cell division protein FtsB [Gammaproteobacteria bacterium]
MKRFALVLSLLLVAIQYRLWNGDGGIHAVQRLEGQLAGQYAQNEQLKRRNQGLYAEIRDLHSGTEAIEERARNELGMIKEGETFFRIVDAD